VTHPLLADLELWPGRCSCVHIDAAASAYPLLVVRRKLKDGRRAGLRGTARARLLGAAVQVFAEHGYRGSSVDQVAEQAGVTKGALYWHFENKRELFLAVLDEWLDPRNRETAEPGAALPTEERRQLTLLNQEFWSLAARDPELRERYLSRQRSLRGEWAVGLDGVGGGPSSVGREQLATGLLALLGGLAMEALIDPQAVPAGLPARLAELMRGGLAAGEGLAEQSASLRSELGVARTPADLHGLFAERVNAGDRGAILSLYEPGAAYLTARGERIEGTAAIGEMLGRVLATEPELEMTTRFSLPIGDIALLGSHWHATSARASPAGPAVTEGLGTEIARRQGGGNWLYVLDAPDGLSQAGA
jgi:AcrR family transcriptional regulator